MMLPAALILGMGLMTPVVDGVPKLNVEQVCQGIAQQGGVSFHDADIAVEKKNCLDSENATRDELAKQWPRFSSADKIACTNEAEMGGDSSYTELLTCLEMARDMRTIHTDTSASNQSAAPVPRGHAQPKP